MYLKLEEIRELVSYCMSEFNLNNKVIVEFNDRFTRRMGDAVYSYKICTGRVRFSKPLFEIASVEEREETIIHEVAHIINDILFPRDSNKFPHGEKWKMIHRMLGKEPNRCHKIDRSNLKRKTKTVECYCKCKIWNITQTLYTRRINKTGLIGICRKCNTVLEKKEYTKCVS